MKLCDVATVKTNYPEADFWIVRRGSLKNVGKPTREFYAEHIGIKVIKTDILIPDYLMICMEYLHNRGVWNPRANGSLSLVNIRVSDVKSIELVPR